MLDPNYLAALAARLILLRDPETRQPGQESARLPFIATIDAGEGARSLPTLGSAVVVAPDRSSSMDADGKWPAAQTAVLQTIDLIGANGELIVIAFNSQPTLLGRARGGWLSNMPLKHALRGIRPENGTAIGAAMQAAFAELRSQKGVSRLVILSDGQTQDEALCRQMADAFAQERIPVDFLATADVNFGLAQHIADVTGGRLEYLSHLTPEGLAQFFGQQVQATQDVVVKNVRVRVRLHPQVRLERAAACYPDIVAAAPGADVETALGDLARADKLQFYGELVMPVPAQDGRIQVGEILITHDVPQAGRMNEQVILPIAVTFVAGAQSAPHAETMSRMQQVKAKLELDQVATAGDPAQALALLQSAQRRTQLAGDARKTQVIAGLIDDVRRTNVVSDGARKTAITAGRRTKVVP